ncbi:hypothetical protein DFH11DRAFT_328693 [Phellopilus nigrolimitatus]|nr:hypothetical protein DFH11DRAFT_328693 [Phellopilus nigrolimitatus]
MQTRLSQAETQFANQLSLTQKLENDLGESRALLKSERDFRTIIMNEKEYLRSREEIMMSEISGLKKNLEEDRIKVRQSDTRFEMLQERFDDQAMMLRMEKKAHGDIQERLFAVETTYTKTIEDNKRTSELQTVQLKEQAKALESQLHDRQTELFNKAQEFASKLSNAELKFYQQMEEAEEKLVVKTDEMTRVQGDLENARTEVQSLQTKIQFLQQESNDLHKELIELKLPSKAHLQEITGLKSQLDGLRKTEELLSQRALTIVSRYEVGDLTAEEKRLIDTVHRTSQAGHEQELVAKGNEIRQVDMICERMLFF